MALLKIRMRISSIGGAIGDKITGCLTREVPDKISFNALLLLSKDVLVCALCCGLSALSIYWINSKMPNKHKSVSCPECSKKMRKDNLKRHMAIVHSGKSILDFPTVEVPISDIDSEDEGTSAKKAKTVSYFYYLFSWLLVNVNCQRS